MSQAETFYEGINFRQNRPLTTLTARPRATGPGMRENFAGCNSDKDTSPTKIALVLRKRDSLAKWPK